MSALVVVLTVLMAMELGVAQPSNDNTNTNIPITFCCDITLATSPANYSGPVNSTFSQLRRKLSTDGVYYATANALENGDAVYGLAQCRKYLSANQCLACFDAAVSQLELCATKIGGYVYLDNCFLRYLNNDQFYQVPQGSADYTAPYCGNESTSQPITAFQQAVQGLLSDIRDATPKTSDYYTASTRRVAGGSNATIYAIGQCLDNISQTICKDCMDTAYNNLSSCLPVDRGSAVNLACFMRYSEFPFFRDNQTINLVPFLNKGSKKGGLIIGVSSGAGCLLLVLAFFLWYQRWKKTKSAGLEDTSALQGVQRYSYEELKIATSNFSDEYLVGKGGFGEVFKAIVDSGDVVAVKRLHLVGLKAREEFEKEVNLINNVRHRNLILQLGCSIDGPEPLLVLEYLPQGSLDKFLWGENRGNLNWKQRSDIIFGIAKGLAHLHEEFHVKIIHRDIKSSNILLDNDFQPKIADFGLARYYPNDQSHISTAFAGTMGYTAPEYATRGQLSVKVDTYSFGIVALEVISGRSCSDVNYSGTQTEYLIQHAWQLYEEDMHIKLIDEALDRNEYEEENVKRIIEIALMCTQSPASGRPTMSDVILMLSIGLISGPRQMSKPTFLGADRRIDIK